MNKAIFEIPQMDCPSKENLIRMKLDGISGIENPDFEENTNQKKACGKRRPK